MTIPETTDRRGRSLEIPALLLCRKTPAEAFAAFRNFATPSHKTPTHFPCEIYLSNTLHEKKRLPENPYHRSRALAAAVFLRSGIYP